MEREQRELRVLAVDDDHGIRLLIADELTEAGCRVFTARDGQEAVSILEVEQVDLIITDNNMPRMSGLELIRWIRAHLPHVATIMMTGDPSQMTMTEAWASGVHRILLKPFSLEHLLLLVGELRGQALAA